MSVFTTASVYSFYSNMFELFEHLEPVRACSNTTIRAAGRGAIVVVLVLVYSLSVSFKCIV